MARGVAGVLDELPRDGYRRGQRVRVLRTTARFERWNCAATLDCDDSLVDQDQLEAWLGIAGRRVGLGDWRPEKSGTFGRFEAEEQPLES